MQCNLDNIARERYLRKRRKQVRDACIPEQSKSITSSLLLLLLMLMMMLMMMMGGGGGGGVILVVINCCGNWL